MGTFDTILKLFDGKVKDALEKSLVDSEISVDFNQEDADTLTILITVKRKGKTE